MSDFTLYYWPVPFRGEFIRAILAFAGAEVEEPGPEAVSAMMDRPPAEQPVPHMAPPMLVVPHGPAIAQMPAIALWLGQHFALMGNQPALAMKIVNDANDVLDEMTQDGGKRMWTPETWRDHIPRLRRWMRIWEDAAGRSRLPATGHLYDSTPGVADIVTATLWGVMTERLPALRPMLEAEAPQVAGLTDRMRALPPLAAQAQASRERFGNAWCGGQIEASLRKAMAAM